MKTLKDIDINNKKVILRVDYNVPIKDGKITDNNRIKESLETIKYLINNNAKIILMSHLGKVKNLEDKEKNTLLPVKEELERLLNKKIEFSSELKGEELERKISLLKNGEIILLENTRHMDYPNTLESSCDEELSKYWASLADVFIFDAFGSAHRLHASTCGIANYLPHSVGFLVEKEIKALDEIKNKPKTLIIGGAKVTDKIGVIKNLLNNTYNCLIGGAMCATFLKSMGINVGKTFVSNEKLEEVKKLIETGKIILPLDVITENGVKDINEITNDETILDIGPKTINIFASYFHTNELVLMNGTMGLWEEHAYSTGTKKIFEELTKAESKVVVCGGDTASAAKYYNFHPYYLSTGGGAALKYLEGTPLPALDIKE